MTQQIINVTGGFNNLGDPAAVGTAKINDNFTELYASKFDSFIVVKSASDFGVIDSTKCYYLDGIIDMGNVSINVPPDGINIKGSTFDVSKLISSSPNYTLFNSTNSGDVILFDLAIEITGTNSKVFNLVDIAGTHAIEIISVNFNNCTSLGELTSYRQFLETGTGRFGGKPQLTLSGTWAGGYRIATSIVRSLDNGIYTLFKSGTSFVMQSRFRTDFNVDLPSLASLFDFNSSSFPTPSTLIIESAIITRNGVFNGEDTNFTPNISSDNLSCRWSNNNGLQNTFVGARNTIATESATIISLVNTKYDLLGTWTASEQQHFDSPANGQLRNLGANPRDFLITMDLIIAGTKNDNVAISVVKWDSSSSLFVTIATQVRTVNALSGIRDVAFFTVIQGFALDKNDYIKIQVENRTAARDVTCELDSYFLVSER